MKITDLNIAVNFTNATVIPALLATIQGQSGTAGAQLRSLCGQLSASAATLLGESPSGNLAFWISLAKCFDAAQALSTITYTLMDNVRLAAANVVVTGPPAIAVQNFSIRMALAELSKILAATTFVSRDQVNLYFGQITTAFSTAELTAADNKDNVAYTALLNLHAAVANDLTTRALPLPKMTTTNFSMRKSSLSIAQFLYQDASRSSEIISENNPIHPLFFPLTVQALSS